MATSFRAYGRLATVRRSYGDGSHGLLRLIGWSFGLAVAILLLMAPTTARAADPDEGGSLLGGLGGVIGPVAEVATPVTEVLEPVATAVVEPVSSALVEPLTTAVVEPVATAVTEPLLDPLDDLVEPVLEPLVEPVVQPASSLLTSVTEPVAQLVDPTAGAVTSSVTPIVEPVTQVVDPVIEPILGDSTTEPDASDQIAPRSATQITTPEGGPDQSPTAIELPSFSPVDALLPAGSPLPEQAPAVPGGRLRDAVAGAHTVFDIAPSRTTWTRPSTDLDAVAVSPDQRATSGIQIGPLGAFSGLGSGQALTGLSFGLALALGLLLLFLLPPPFRVSRLQLAAVFWRPQRFVGPLVRPG